MVSYKNTFLKYPKSVLLVGSIVLILAGVFGAGLFSGLSNNDEGFFANDTPSRLASEKIKTEFGASGAEAIVLFEAKSDSVGVKSPEFMAEVTSVLEPLEGEQVSSYYSTGSDRFISNDARSTYALVNFSQGSNKDNYAKLRSVVDDYKGSALKISLGGSLVGVEDTQKQATDDLTKAELISLPILVLLLLLFFRRPVAAAIPIVMSLLTIAGALAVARLVGQIVTIDTYALNVITILGVGLSVDYSLLVVNRFREEFSIKNNNLAKAVSTTVATAGRTILFSAVTVIACLLSLLLFPIDFMHSVSIGGAAAVFVAMLISTLLVPPALMVIGHKVVSKEKKVPVENTQSFWRRLPKFVMKRPVLAIMAGLLLVVAFTWPIGQFKTAGFGWRTMASNSPASYVGGILEDKFGARGGSLTALVTFDKTPSATELCEVSSQMSEIGGVKEVVGAYSPSEQLGCEQISQMEQFDALPPALVQMSDNFTKDNLALININTDFGDYSPEMTSLINDLRAMTIDGAKIDVTGMAALSHDTQKIYVERAVYVVLIIVIAMVLLLGVLLKSIVLPIQAIIINSLGLLISLGVVIMLFQFGWLTEIFHHTPVLGLEPSIPILICVIAFGLSMDYSVFLYARMHETYEQTGDPQKSIVEGVAKTGPIITAAALVLFVVVAAFATSKISIIQQIGIGLSVAVLVDAFFIRTVFVPAVMKLFGKASWYAPKWLKKIAIRHD